MYRLRLGIKRISLTAIIGLPIKYYHSEEEVAQSIQETISRRERSSNRIKAKINWLSMIHQAALLETNFSRVNKSQHEKTTSPLSIELQPANPQIESNLWQRTCGKMP